jgi:hypothetical protein
MRQSWPPGLRRHPGRARRRGRHASAAEQWPQQGVSLGIAHAAAGQALRVAPRTQATHMVQSHQQRLRLLLSPGCPNLSLYPAGPHAASPRTRPWPAALVSHTVAAGRCQGCRWRRRAPHRPLPSHLGWPADPGWPGALQCCGRTSGSQPQGPWLVGWRPGPASVLQARRAFAAQEPGWQSQDGGAQARRNSPGTLCIGWAPCVLVGHPVYWLGVGAKGGTMWLVC